MNYKTKAHGIKKAALVAYKGGACMDCGGVFPPCCFDFDHRDPFLKSFGIGEKTGGRISLEELKVEADKCDLVCANCHRVRTMKSGLVRARSSVAHKGVVIDENWRTKLSEANKGKPHTAEHNANVSAALTGKVVSMETRQKISDTLKRKGIAPSMEARRKGGSMPKRKLG